MEVQAHYLDAMGIVCWQLRDTTQQPELGFLLSVQAKPVAVLIAKSESAEEENLLTNIVNALDGALEKLSSDQLVSYAMLPKLTFGSQLAKAALSNKAELLVLPSLREMLIDPSLKREVWQKLRPFKS